MVRSLAEKYGGRNQLITCISARVGCLAQPAPWPLGAPGVVGALADPELNSYVVSGGGSVAESAARIPVGAAAECERTRVDVGKLLNYQSPGHCGRSGSVVEVLL